MRPGPAEVETFPNSGNGSFYLGLKLARGAINPEPSDVTPIVSISHVAYRPEVRQTAFREIAPHCRQA